MQTDLPEISIIVTNYNGKMVLKDCLASLRKINYPKSRYEVIFVDNNSSDGSVEYVKRNFPWVKVIALKENLWFTGANNFGLKKAKGEYIVFLNNDTYVEKNWLIELVKVAQSNEKIGICGSKIVYFSNPRILQYAGAYLDMLGSPFTIGLQQKDTGRDKEPKEVFYAPGTSFLIKRSVLKKLKYCFDPSFRAYFEEMDLCWRVKLLGYKVMYVPTSKVLHKMGFTFKKIRDETYFLNYRNKILSFKKNLRTPLKEIILILVLIRMFFPVFIDVIKKRRRYGITIFKHVFEKPVYDLNLKKIPLKKQLSVLSLPILERYSQDAYLRKNAEKIRKEIFGK